MLNRMAAVIVIHQPDRALLLRLLQVIGGDVDTILLFLNSTLTPELIEDCRAAAQPTPLRLLGSGVNVGLGRAYNEAARAARASGCDLLTLFDQDSTPLPGFASRLAAVFGDARRHFGRVAAVGPRPVPPDPGPDYKFPFITQCGNVGEEPSGRELREASFLISSGSVIDLRALSEVGPFREDFFVDGIDMEWCFRARACGFHCIMATAEPMLHRLGSGLVSIPLLNIRLTRQPPERVFTYARNQTAMMRMSHVPFWWKARTAGSLALRFFVFGLHGHQAAAVIRGILAGLRLQVRSHLTDGT